MSSELMRSTANVLEKLAEQLDQDEQGRKDVAHQERLKVANALGEKIASVTGEELSPAVLERIAASDHDVVSLFTKLAERAPHAEPPDPMGEAHNPNNDAAYTTKTARDQRTQSESDQQFLDWVMS